ncbi:MAG TPA: 50S ribosomal protein L25 [Chthonomonadaceae bacterium]|nr:50S ribosomal protein L25 [Chthonomonadaceae bacterium]
MPAQPVQFKASPIQARTKGEVKRLRKSGFIPISIQHRGQETLHLQAEAKPLEEQLRLHGEAALLEMVLEPDGQRQTVLFSAIQRHPVTHSLQHVAFRSVIGNEMIKAHVPIVLHGEPEAVRLHTAVLQPGVDQLEIRCLPQNLPDHITVEVSQLGIGDVIHVSDLPKSDKYEILTPTDTAVVSLASLAARVTEEEAIAPEQVEAAEEGTEPATA